jgi:uncharacterized protein
VYQVTFENVGLPCPGSNPTTSQTQASIMSNVHELSRCMRAVTTLISMGVLAAILPSSPAAQVMLSPTGAPGAEGSVISVAATAEVGHLPERVVLYVSLAGADTTNQMALAHAMAKREGVREALRGIGYPVQQIQTWGVGMGARPQMGPRPPSNEPEQMALFGLQIPVEPAERLDAVLQALAGSGIEAVRVASFEATGTAPARERAVREAVAQARRDAEAMAAAAGVRLGELRSLSTGPDYSQMMGDQRMMGVGNPYDRGVTLTPGRIPMRVTIMASWEIAR